MTFRRSRSLHPFIVAVVGSAALIARVHAQDVAPPGAAVGEPSLESLAGDYESSGLRVQVKLRADGVLTIAFPKDVPAPPVRELVPSGNLRFAQKGLPNNNVEFIRDPAGNIRGLMLQGPYGSTFRSRLSATRNAVSPSATARRSAIAPPL